MTANDDFCLDCLSLSDTLFGFVADGGGSGLVQWTPDSKQIVVSIGHEGAVDLAVVDAKKGGIRFLTQGKHLVLGSNVSRNGKMMAVLCGDATSLVEAGTFDLGAALVSNTKPQILTSCNKELFTEIEVSRPEMFRVESTDGVKVQGWAMRPTTGKAKKFAAVLEVHGAPMLNMDMRFFTNSSCFALKGLESYSQIQGAQKAMAKHFALPLRAIGETRIGTIFRRSQIG